MADWYAALKEQLDITFVNLLRAKSDLTVPEIWVVQPGATATTRMVNPRNIVISGNSYIDRASRRKATRITWEEWWRRFSAETYVTMVVYDTARSRDWSGDVNAADMWGNGIYVDSIKFTTDSIHPFPITFLKDTPAGLQLVPLGTYNINGVSLDVIDPSTAQLGGLDPATSFSDWIKWRVLSQTKVPVFPPNGPPCQQVGHRFSLSSGAETGVTNEP